MVQTAALLRLSTVEGRTLSEGENPVATPRMLISLVAEE